MIGDFLTSGQDRKFGLYFICYLGITIVKTASMGAMVAMLVLCGEHYGATRLTGKRPLLFT